MSLTQFLLILRARWWAAILVFIVTVGTTVGVSLVLPKQYTASSAVVVDAKQDALSGIGMAIVAPSYMATQVDIINSDRVARAVVRSLKLEESPAIREAWLEATEGRGTIADWLAETLQKKLEVKPSRESNVINIGFTGNNPEYAAAVANAFAQSYLDVVLELRIAPARQFAAFFEEQTRSARERLEVAQQRLSNFVQGRGITAADERMDFEMAKLSETSSQLTAIQGLTTDSQSKRQAGKADTLSEVIQNPLINSLKSDLTRAEAKLNESNTILGPNHPQVQRLQAEISALKSQLDAETRKVTASIETTYEVNRKREAELRSAVSSQKDRVLSINRQRDQLAVLKRDVEAAQRSFELVAQRASQTSIESQASQTNVSILNNAVPPIEHSKPKLLLNTLVSIFLGTLLAVGVALALELMDRRVRSAEDVLQALPVPILGTVGSAKGAMKKLRRELAQA